MTNSYDVAHGLSQVHPGPEEPVEVAQQDDTLARTGNTARDQEMYAAGIRIGEENAKNNAAIRGGLPDGWKLVPDTMTLGERIAHVGGRTNAQGYIEFGSPMAVDALIEQVLRDIDCTRQDDDGAYQARYRVPGGQWSSWGHVVCGVKGHEQELRYLPGGRCPTPAAGDAQPSKPGVYAWSAGTANALVLVDRRPSAHSPGGVLNGHVIESTKFYDGCAVESWGRDGHWTLLHDFDAAQRQGDA